MLIIFDQATFSDNVGLQIMTAMLNLPPEKEARLIAAAQAKGLSTDALVREALDRILAEGPAPAGLPRSLQDELTPEGWVRQFDAWVDSHDRTTPLFSDEAISRESIYPDRFSLCWVDTSLLVRTLQPHHELCLPGNLRRDSRPAQVSTSGLSGPKPHFGQPLMCNECVNLTT